MTEIIFDVVLKVSICLDTSDGELPKPYDIAIGNVAAVGETVRDVILEHLFTGPDNDASIFLANAVSDASGFCVDNIGIDASVALALEPRQINQRVVLYDTVAKGELSQ